MFGIGDQLINATIQNQILVAKDTQKISRIYRYPAKYDDAQIHKIANQFGYNSKTASNGKNASLCPCCDLPMNTVKLPLNYGTTPDGDKVKAGSKIFMLDAGTSMFFTFIKMSIAYLFLRFVLSDGFNVITSILGRYCAADQSNCKNNFAAKFSNYNKDTQDDQPMVNVVDILNLVTVIISIVFFYFYRRYQYSIYTIVDLANHTQYDYTLLVEKIPIFLPTEYKKGSKQLQFDYEEQLKYLFQDALSQLMKQVKTGNPQNFDDISTSMFQLLQKDPSIQNLPKVTTVSLCFDLTEMQKIIDLRQEMMDQYIKNMEQNEQIDKNSCAYIPNQISELNKEYIELSKRFAADNTACFNLTHFVGKAFVSFQLEQYKQFLLKSHKIQQKFELHGQSLKISEAVSPSDVYWFNMKVSNYDRTMSIIYSFIILFLSLIFSFALLMAIQMAQTKAAPTKDGSTKSEILSFSFTILMTILTVVINYILSVVCLKLTVSQRHKTKTDYIGSLTIKNVMVQFLNTAIIYYIISIFDGVAALDQNGLLMKVTSLIAVSGFINIANNAIQLGTLFSCLMNKFKYNDKDTINMFQIQLNKEMQDPQFSFSDKYAYYIVQIYVVSFYSYIAPYLSLILIIIFAIQYWVDKFNLFTRYSCPADFNYRLSRLTLKTFECSIFIFALGNFLLAPTIHYQSHTEYHIINLISLILSFLYCLSIIFLPKKYLQNYQERNLQQISYNECLQKGYFRNFYWTSNPATSFAKQPDINNKKKYIVYEEEYSIADVNDYNQFKEQQDKGIKYIETYQQKDEKVLGRLRQTINNEDNSQIVVENPNDYVSNFFKPQ